MMRCAVTGLSGQVVRAIAGRAESAGIIVIPLGRPDLDLENPATILPALKHARPDIVVNAAAYTAVDQAETEESRALAINGNAAGIVAEAAHALNIPVIQISTDYVFDGTASGAYRETDPVNPINAYGRSKLAGELAVARANPRHAILRTSWVYDAEGKNFVRTMLRLAADRPELRVVADQFGAPTFADDIADGIFAVASRMMAASGGENLSGVYHMTGTGATSWAEFAAEIFRQSQALGGPAAKVIPISASDYPTPARRPANSRLNCEKFELVFSFALPDWREALSRCLMKMKKTEGWMSR